MIDDEEMCKRCEEIMIGLHPTRDWLLFAPKNSDTVRKQIMRLSIKYNAIFLLQNRYFCWIINYFCWII